MIARVAWIGCVSAVVCVVVMVATLLWLFEYHSHAKREKYASTSMVMEYGANRLSYPFVTREVGYRRESGVDFSSGRTGPLPESSPQSILILDGLQPIEDPQDGSSLVVEMYGWPWPFIGYHEYFRPAPQPRIPVLSRLQTYTLVIVKSALTQPASWRDLWKFTVVSPWQALQSFIAMWVLTAGVLVFGMWVYRKMRARWRRRRGMCPRCGYGVARLERCPECDADCAKVIVKQAG